MSINGFTHRPLSLAAAPSRTSRFALRRGRGTVAHCELASGFSNSLSEFVKPPGAEALGNLRTAVVRANRIKSPDV